MTYPRVERKVTIDYFGTVEKNITIICYAPVNQLHYEIHAVIFNVQNSLKNSLTFSMSRKAHIASASPGHAIQGTPRARRS